MLLAALSVLMLGAAPASAQGEVPPPCHDGGAASRSQDHAPAPAGTSGKAMAAMACCVACVVAPSPQPPVRLVTLLPDRPAPPVPSSVPTGLSPAPEHGPPKD